MTEVVQTPVATQPFRTYRLPLGCAYLIEVANSISTNLLMNGIAFYTTQRFGWTTSQNLLLMMAQGLVYAVGALSAGALAQRISKGKLLLGVNAGLLAMIFAMRAGESPWTIIPILLAFTFTSTLTWPLVESLVTEGCSPKQMNRRITLYNMSWSSVCVAVIAVYGTILQYWPGGPMTIALTCQVISLLAGIVLFLTHRSPAPSSAQESHADPDVATQLASQRRLALWLSRLSLPAVFVIINSVMGLFPKFAVTAEIGLVWTTVLASLWMASRFVTFTILGATNWWHTRPRLLLVAGVLMLLAFLMIALPAERFGFFAEMPLWAVVSLVAAAELVLGVVAGFIFSASLYFGMVLSDGSAEHGGYHEALIGVGMVMGPGLASGAQAVFANDSRMPAIISVTTLMVVTLAFALSVAAKFRAQQPK